MTTSAHIHALIKGDAEAALIAAQKNLIRSKDIIEIKALTSGPSAQTVLILPHCYFQRVAEWYIADGQGPAPYPVGTLLHYTAEAAE